MNVRIAGLAVLTAALSVAISATSDSLLAGPWRVTPRSEVPGHIVPVALPAPALAAASKAGGGKTAPAAVQAIPTPDVIGSQIAGTFDDATGHSSQSHLVYAVNSRVWWLFTLTSANDSQGGTNHIVKSFHSVGPGPGARQVGRGRRQSSS